MADFKSGDPVALKGYPLAVGYIIRGVSPATGRVLVSWRTTVTGQPIGLSMPEEPADLVRL